MSVDVGATVVSPFPVAALLNSMQRVMSELIGAEAPPVTAIDGRVRARGELVREGRRLPPDSAEMLGDRIPRNPDGRFGSRHLELVVAGHHELVWLMVMDFDWEDQLGDCPSGVSVTFSPMRTCLAVVTALSGALAAAIEGGGELIEFQIRFPDSPEADARAFIEGTRLPPSLESFEKCCVTFMRQFAALEGWR